MTKKLFTTLIVIVMLAIITSTGFADKNQYDITISKPGVAWTIAPCPAPGTFGDTWKFINASPTVAIMVKVWNKNGTVTTHNIPALSFDIHTIALGDCEIKVFDPAGTQELVECAGAYCNTTPTLTQWGIFILIALMVGSAVFIMLKRRNATVPA